MERIALTLTPLDTLFFRDGRPFNASDQAVGGLPTPMPLAGALRTAILSRHPEFDFQEFAAMRETKPDDISAALVAGGMKDDWYNSLQIRGPFLALRDTGSGSLIPLLPVPNTLVRLEDTKTGIGRWVASEPLPAESRLPGWTSPATAPNLRPLWRTEAQDEKPPLGFLTLPAIEQFLLGQASQITDQDWFKADDVYQFDGRTGIEVDPDRLTAAESKIYGIQLLALTKCTKRTRWCGPDTANGSSLPRYHGCEVVLYAEILHNGGPDDLAARVTGALPLGGEGHYVDCQPTTKPVAWPTDGTANRKVWYLAQPGFFDTPAEASAANGASVKVPSWQPKAIPADQLKAASTGHPLPVSGWDVARKAPRPTRFAVPAGAVFYSDGLTQLPHQSLCSAPDDIREGWGFALSGEWT